MDMSEFKLKEKDTLSRLEWAMGTFRNERVYEHLRPKLTILIDTFLGISDTYAIETFIKSFCEPLIYLESILLDKRGIHPSKLDLNKIKQLTPDEVKELHSEVYEIMQSEIDRQYRNYFTFLEAAITSYIIKKRTK
jgi:hypothetical protein